MKKRNPPLPSNPHGYTEVAISYKGKYTSLHYHQLLLFYLLWSLGIDKQNQ